MSKQEKLRQAWYALGLIAVPLTVYALDRKIAAYDALPLILHVAIALLIGLVILTLLRLTNPWEPPVGPESQAPAGHDTEPGPDDRR